jgi:rhodanese-related sulfurtransferase
MKMFRTLFSPSRVSKISPAQAKARLASGDAARLIDVRTAEEYAQGHIPGSELLPLDLLPVLARERLADKDAEIIVYCQSGGRSAQAARQLDAMGYTQVSDLGGIMSWPYEITRK